MPDHETAKHVQRLQRAIKAETNKARKRLLQSRLRDLCADLARRNYRARLADMGNMSAY